MKIQFYISGSVIAESTSNVIPPIGAEVIISMTSYKKGMWPGTVLRFQVSDEFPPIFDYLHEVVNIDVSEWEVVQEGTEPKDH